MLTLGQTAVEPPQELRHVDADFVLSIVAVAIDGLAPTCEKVFDLGQLGGAECGAQDAILLLVRPNEQGGCMGLGRGPGWFESSQAVGVIGSRRPT